MSIKKTFGTRFRNLRYSLKLEQTELAKEMHVTKQTISNWENGNVLPSVDMLVRLAQFFHVETDYLLGLEHPHPDLTSGLTDEEREHLLLIVEDIRKNRKITE